MRYFFPFVYSTVLAIVAIFFLASPSDTGLIPDLVRRLAASNQRYRERFFRKAMQGRDVRPTSYSLAVWLIGLIAAPFFLFIVMPMMSYLTNAVLVITGIVYFLILPIVLFTRAEHAVIHAMQRRFQSKMPVLRANIDPKQYATLEFALGSVMSLQQYNRLMQQIDDLFSTLPSHMR